MIHSQSKIHSQSDSLIEPLLHFHFLSVTMTQSNSLIESRLHFHFQKWLHFLIGPQSMPRFHFLFKLQSMLLLYSIPAPGPFSMSLPT